MPTPSSLIADPAPLGLIGFGMTTMLLSCINAGIIAAGATMAVLPLAAAFGGLAQLLAGMWEFKRGNTFGATAFTSYGCFWFSYYLLVDVFLAKTTPATISPIIGLYLFMWGVFTLYMFIASLAGPRALWVVFCLLFITFFLLAFGAWGWSPAFTTLGGYAGILTAIAAIYTSFAIVTNANFKRTVLPVA
ncbi:MAG: acetate uptake transporter [Candidatus Dormibacteria bacterium]